MILKFISKLRRWYGDKLRNYSILNFATTKKVVIATFYRHNGLGFADRLRHILSVFLFCQENGIDFKIKHDTPFKLDMILSPNKYDWRIKKFYSNSFFNTKVLIIWSSYKSQGIPEEKESSDQELALSKLLNVNKQCHVYGNAHIKKDKWKEAFETLFKPSPLLQKSLDKLSLPLEYRAVTVRFQNSLGDFEEAGIIPLNPNEQESLIKATISEIIDIYNKSDRLPLLVTSDSVTFLNRLSEFSFIHTIPGKIAHPGFSPNESIELYLKSFLDLYSLSRAKDVTLLLGPHMYKSGFPEFAALIGSGKFSIRNFGINKTR